MDEVAQIPTEIINLVIIPMMNTRQDPFDTSGRKNHLIMASSAYYQFNHLYERYLLYLERTDKNSSKYDPNYGLHVYTVDDMPPGWMDDAIIKEARETMTEIQYMMEYLCFKGDALVTTEEGYKRIDSLQAGEKVLTHLGNWRNIIGVSKKRYTGDFVKIEAFGSYKTLESTSDHPIYINRNGEYMWEHAKNIVVGDYLVRPVNNRISDTKELSISDFLTIDHLHMYYNGSKYVYPTPSQFKGNPLEDQRVGKSLIKSAISDNIPISKGLMRLAGYYLAEGSSSSNNQRALTFSFNKSEVEYVNQVKSDLFEVFGVNAKSYTNNNCTSVYVNSRILCNFFGNLLGKGHFNKSIHKYLLEQDSELLSELIKCAINGDGCLNNSREGRKPYVSYYSTSRQLVDDMSVAINRLGISTSVRKSKNSGHSIIDGRVIVGNENGGFICCSQGDSARKLFKMFNMDTSPVNSSLSARKIITDGNNVLCKVHSVSSESYEGDVYNFEVEQDNSYCVNDFAVHNCVFPADSDGFFPANLFRGVRKESVMIESEGERASQYVFGIDPARTGDNFALVVLKLGNPNKIVACYTLNRNTFPQMHEFIRSKIRLYEKNGGEVVRIHMDNGGGGQTIRDYLAEEYAYFDPEKQRFVTEPAILDMDYDDHQFMSGRRIVRLQVFSSQSVNSMNFDLKADLEKRKITIPLIPATEEDEEMLYRTILDEVDKMVQETMTIVTTPLSNGFMKFDTPKQRMKKDRYSAFMLACTGAREIQRDIAGPPVKRLVTGFASTSYLNGGMGTGGVSTFGGLR